MRRFAVIVIVALVGATHAAFAQSRIRLAQTSTVTNCMMICNTQAANCQTTCLIPSATAITPGATTPTPPTTNAPIINPGANTACQSACSITQLACQTSCARQFPSQ